MSGHFKRTAFICNIDRLKYYKSFSPTRLFNFKHPWLYKITNWFLKTKKKRSICVWHISDYSIFCDTFSNGRYISFHLFHYCGINLIHLSYNNVNDLRNHAANNDTVFRKQKLYLAKRKSIFATKVNSCFNLIKPMRNGVWESTLSFSPDCSGLHLEVTENNILKDDNVLLQLSPRCVWKWLS